MTSATLTAIFGMQQALVGLTLLAPMAGTMGVQVVNFRMAFFSDAISHSAFTGVALGLLFAVDPLWTMPLFGVLVGLGIMAMARNLPRTTGGMFWWALLVSASAAVSGLVISAQPWAGTATGATIILVACLWFAVSAVVAFVREGRIGIL